MILGQEVCPDHRQCVLPWMAYPLPASVWQSANPASVWQSANSASLSNPASTLALSLGFLMFPFVWLVATSANSSSPFPTVLPLAGSVALPFSQFCPASVFATWFQTCLEMLHLVCKPGSHCPVIK